MSRRSWNLALAVVALSALVLALYVQVFSLRAQRQEARAAARRLDEALAASRARLKAEILAELRPELAGGTPAARAGDGPLPDAVLRRSEAEGGAFEQIVDPERPERSLARLDAALRRLAAGMEEADRAQRRGLEELRLSVDAELEAARRTTALILAVLVPLVLHLLLSLRRGGDAAAPTAPGRSAAPDRLTGSPS